MINIVGSKRYSQYTSIMEETGCSIYLPSIWNHNNITQQSTVYITGSTSDTVNRTIGLMQKLVSQKVIILFSLFFMMAQMFDRSKQRVTQNQH